MKHKLTLLYVTNSGWNLSTINFMNQPIKIQLESPKWLSQQIRKLYNKTLGTSVMNSRMSHPSLDSCSNKGICIFSNIFFIFFPYITILTPMPLGALEVEEGGVESPLFNCEFKKIFFNLATGAISLGRVVVLSPNIYLLTIPGPIRSYTDKDNHIVSAVTEILRQTHIKILLFL